MSDYKKRSSDVLMKFCLIGGLTFFFVTLFFKLCEDWFDIKLFYYEAISISLLILLVVTLFIFIGLISFRFLSKSFKPKNRKKYAKPSPFYQNSSQSKIYDWVRPLFLYNDEDSRIIIPCLFCQTKLRIKPPSDDSYILTTCPHCYRKFKVILNDHGNIEFLDFNETNTIAWCYQELEIPKNATVDEIKQAYRKKIIQYHPDKVSNLGNELKILAEEKTRNLNKAYETLLRWQRNN